MKTILMSSIIGLVSAGAFTFAAIGGGAYADACCCGPACSCGANCTCACEPGCGCCEGGECTCPECTCECRNAGSCSGGCCGN